jgi:hypothetical protein
MQRDLDLARQILFDLEAHGAETSLTNLHPSNLGEPRASQELDDRVRYHLRLLVDAGLVKEVERTTAGVPSVRLTNSGHELLELARSEPNWREAKRICRERTGGLSLAVVRTLLVKWAVQSTAGQYDSPYGQSAGRRYRRPVARSYRETPPLVSSVWEQEVDESAPGWRLAGHRPTRDGATGYRPDYRETFAWTDASDTRPRFVEEGYYRAPAEEIGVTLPIYVV